MSKSSPLIRKILISVLAFHLIVLFNFQSSSADQMAESIRAQSTVVFTPRITPINATVTLRPTIPATLRSRTSPTQNPVTPTARPDPHYAIIETSAGLITIGYDFVKGSDPPQWIIWIGEDVLFVNPNDASTGALLAAFREEVNNIIAAKKAFDNADRDISDGHISMFFEGLGVLGGVGTSVLSCGSVPLTFWLAGGTGWACAAGITATVGSGGALAMSFNANKQARKDKIDAGKELDRATTEAEELFEALKS